MSSLDELLQRFRKIAEGEQVSLPAARFKTYVITIFRGGIGKSTLAFNLAWQISRAARTLLVDVCPQRNFTQSLMGSDTELLEHSIYDALLPKVMPGTSEVSEEDLICSVAPYCPPFQRGKGVFLIPGSTELFLFPSLLYSQLSTAAQLQSRAKLATNTILRSIVTIVGGAAKQAKATKILIDTSPFFGGATHLAWVAADALIIPVRVDQHSMEALKLTLAMLENPDMDFLRINRLGGIKRIPKIHAIAMTHCGWNRQAAFTPDRSTQSYLSQVIDIIDEHANLFSSDRPIEHVHLLDDFHAAGRISGSKRIPLAKLSVGETFMIEGQRLEVNQSVTRYKREMRALATTL